MERVVALTVAKIGFSVPNDSYNRALRTKNQFRDSPFNKFSAESRPSSGFRAQKKKRKGAASIFFCRPPATSSKQRNRYFCVSGFPIRRLRPRMAKQPGSDVDFDPRFTGRVLAPPDTSQPSNAWWGSNCFFGPVVVPGPLPTAEAQLV